MINAAIVQFEQIRPIYRKFPYVKTKVEIKAILGKIRATGGMVIYSLVAPQLRNWIRTELASMDIYAIDLLGPILDRIQSQWDLVPLLQPGLLRGFAEESLRVADAVDFTLNHDDGQGVETLGRADLILLGVSRTSKTPTSLYLACNHGLKVANFPLVPGSILPDKIFTLKKQKIGLMINLERLAFLRKTRWKHEIVNYIDVSHIRQELDYTEKVFKQIKQLHVIDVTYSSIEEVAARIMEARLGAREQAA